MHDSHVVCKISRLHICSHGTTHIIGGLHSGHILIVARKQIHQHTDGSHSVILGFRINGSHTALVEISCGSADVQLGHVFHGNGHVKHSGHGGSHAKAGTADVSDLGNDARSVGDALHDLAIGGQSGCAVVDYGSCAVKYADHGCAALDGLIVQAEDLLRAYAVESACVFVAVLHKGKSQLAADRAVAREDGIVGLVFSAATDVSTHLHKGSGVEEREHSLAPFGVLLFHS